VISKVTIDEVKARTDIVEVIGDFVVLKKAGSNYKALSPFTNEKTPSFFVSPSKGIFKCFSTGKAGDAIGFVMEHEGLTYSETIRYLAKKYGVEIVEDEVTDEQMQQQNERESLLIVLNFAKDYFRDILLNHPDGQGIGGSYFKERGFSPATIEKFDLGFSLDEWDGLIKSAQEKGHSQEILEKAGLIIRKDEKTYDRFRGRAIFPIHNISGRVIAFGARILKADKNQPKYINSPETEVYHKSEVLYGIFQAKKAIRDYDNCYLVEGYTDVISLHQSAIENVVASSGTALTVEQIRLIKRFTNNVTVLFDGDAAGIRASLRGIDMILENDMNVRAVVFPAGEDPDSYSRKLGTTAFQDYLRENTTDFIRFKAGLFAEEAGKDPVKKAESIREIVESVALVPDPVKRAIYIQECSQLLQMEEQVLLSELNKILIKKRKDRKDGKEGPSIDFAQEAPPVAPLQLTATKLEDTLALQERESVRLLLNYGHETMEDGVTLAHLLLQELEDVAFTHPVYTRLLAQYRARILQGLPVRGQDFMETNDQEMKAVVADLITTRYEISDQWEEKFHMVVKNEKDQLPEATVANIARLKFRVVQKLVRENMEKLKSAQSEEETDKYLAIHEELKKLEKGFADVLGIVLTR
jgi:DNA primase